MFVKWHFEVNFKKYSIAIYKNGAAISYGQGTAGIPGRATPHGVPPNPTGLVLKKKL